MVRSWVTVWELGQFNSPRSRTGREPLLGQTPTGFLELCAIRNSEISSNKLEKQLKVYVCAHTYTQTCTFLSFLKFNLYCICFPLPFTPLMPPPFSNHHTVVHVHESFFLFAQSLLLLPLHPHQLLSSCPSMSLSPFSLLVQFVHQIPQMSESIWYLSFSEWLISLSICSPGPSYYGKG